ncbi:RNA polymerase subunit sigma [Sinomicrobium pectinilyticum]|uniref:RNA polymerase subunit sigma n=1 Tax=Sinomicrobium pectinilyticum TaxID=1084421 RepID=A0A3N0EQ43_SINP1|nr:DUF6596 domain-containing protein [Sinomicrobium pectinilyticum]RNL89912.1 RNA polymerase subunit sigma [Sinomicrobium pectinilyticum]
MSDKKTYREVLPYLFRHEYARMTAVLCRHFGLKDMETAEDIASATFLKATEEWKIQGMPDNPAGWLYTVARNKAKDHLRRRAVFETKVSVSLKEDSPEGPGEIDFSEEVIADSQLAMIFWVCDPVNAPENQICLALQVLCGFSIKEIAHAFLSAKETIKKRLFRAKANLRKNNVHIDRLPEPVVLSRMDSVLRTLYLLFNEGYFSRSGNHLIRKDFCSEAIRLALVLVGDRRTNTPQVNALLALMCFQSSRLDARTDNTGETVLFEEQDKKEWDKDLIQRGNYYLVEACSGNAASKYHLEAGIAYWHTTPTDKDKWQHILQLYNRLILIEYSPATALNRAFAYARVYGNEEGIREVEKLRQEKTVFYHALLGYLYTTVNKAEALKHYSEALAKCTSGAEKRNLKKKIAGLR